ncbi:heavy metal-associated domain-containing protein [Chlorogloeopsis sp. ULAP01]|jgi:copper chaperone CopZ|uniref:heavy-metal-associated domain-containing protein n=1 Tax=Chlorogloeopsis sp. ULAP01 TaxID=3056483 RepID=UPI00338DAC6E
MKIIHLQLENIMCDFCAEVIERALHSLPGISECSVNSTEKRATIEYNPQLTNLETIQKALEIAGYAARPLDKQFN